jgi:hypothetical protein
MVLASKNTYQEVKPMRIYLDNNFKVIKQQDFDVQFVQFNQVAVEVYTTLPQTDRSVGYNWVRPDGYKTQQVAMTYMGPVLEGTTTYYTWAADVTPYHTAIIPGTQDYGFALISFTITKIVNEAVMERFTSPVLRITVVRSIEPDITILPPNALESVESRVATLEATTGEIAEELDFPNPLRASEAISKGEVVMFVGIQGDAAVIAKATSAAVNQNARVIIGVAGEDIPANNSANYEVVWFGKITGLSTNTYGPAGTVLYFNHAVNGGLTSTKPTAPNKAITIAAVIRSMPGGAGSLLIRPLLIDENIFG